MKRKRREEKCFERKERTKQKQGGREVVGKLGRMKEVKNKAKNTTLPHNC